MSFSTSSTNEGVRLRPVLSVTCSAKDGSNKKSTINLDEKIGNKNGAFAYPSGDFSETASNIRLDSDGHTLRATLGRGDGTSAEANIDLDNCIKNDNGVLTWTQ